MLVHQLLGGCAVWGCCWLFEQDTVAREEQLVDNQQWSLPLKVWEQRLGMLRLACLLGQPCQLCHMLLPWCPIPSLHSPFQNTSKHYVTLQQVSRSARW